MSKCESVCVRVSTFQCTLFSRQHCFGGGVVEFHVYACRNIKNNGFYMLLFAVKCFLLISTHTHTPMHICSHACIVVSFIYGKIV